MEGIGGRYFENCREAEVVPEGRGNSGSRGPIRVRLTVKTKITPNLWFDGNAAVAADFADPDPARAQRAMQAMFGKKKLDIGALRAAADG